MSELPAKQLIYAQFAHIAKALSSPARIALLDILAQAERSVEDLAHEANLTIANTSAHLKVLAHAHLVLSRKAGIYVYYRLADPSVYQLWNALRITAEQQIAEIDRLMATHFPHRGALAAVSRKELAARMGDPDTIIIDVRPPVEYEYGHIAGARSLPLEEMERRLEELPKDAHIVAYCRGPYCVLADEAVMLLHQHGFTALRYQDGFPDWATAGLPVEQTDK